MAVALVTASLARVAAIEKLTTRKALLHFVIQ